MRHATSSQDAAMPADVIDDKLIGNDPLGALLSGDRR
jgi:hypothetical protein